MTGETGLGVNTEFPLLKVKRTKRPRSRAGRVGNCRLKGHEQRATRRPSSPSDATPRRTPRFHARRRSLSEGGRRLPLCGSAGPPDRARNRLGIRPEVGLRLTQGLGGWSRRSCRGKGSGDAGGRAAAGASGDAFWIAGVAGRAEGGVFCGGAHGELVHVVLADDDRPGCRCRGCRGFWNRLWCVEMASWPGTPQRG